MTKSISQLGQERGESIRRTIPHYEVPDAFSGIMGRAAESDEVEVPGRSGWVWVRTHAASGSQPMQAWSPTVRPWKNLPVLIADDRSSGRRLIVLDVDWAAFGGPQNWGSADETPYYRDYWTRKRRILDFHGHATGNGFIVEVFEDWFPVATGYRFFAGGSIDIASSLPVSGSRYATVYLRFAWNTTTLDYDEILGVANGTVITGGFGPGGFPTTPDEGEAYLPTVPAGAFACVSFLLVAGSTRITDSDAYDVRSAWNPSAASVGMTDAAIPTQVGQVLYSVDGMTWAAKLPVIDSVMGWVHSGDILVVT